MEDDLNMLPVCQYRLRVVLGSTGAVQLVDPLQLDWALYRWDGPGRSSCGASGHGEVVTNQSAAIIVRPVYQLHLLLSSHRCARDVLIRKHRKTQCWWVAVTGETGGRLGAVAGEHLPVGPQ